jgi:hypothetical protein
MAITYHWVQGQQEKRCRLHYEIIEEDVKPKATTNTFSKIKVPIQRNVPDNGTRSAQEAVLVEPATVPKIRDMLRKDNPGVSTANEQNKKRTQDEVQLKPSPVAKAKHAPGPQIATDSSCKLQSVSSSFHDDCVVGPIASKSDDSKLERNNYQSLASLEASEFAGAVESNTPAIKVVTKLVTPQLGTKAGSPRAALSACGFAKSALHTRATSEDFGSDSDLGQEASPPLNGLLRNAPDTVAFKGKGDGKRGGSDRQTESNDGPTTGERVESDKEADSNIEPSTASLLKNPIIRKARSLGRWLFSSEQSTHSESQSTR